MVVAALAGDDGDLLAVGQGAREVAHLIAHAHGEGGLGEPGSDGRGGVVAGRAVGQFEVGSIRKNHVHDGGGC